MACCAFAQVNETPGSTRTNLQSLKSVEQMLVVTTKDWTSVPGELRRFERPKASQPWREVGSHIPVVVGRGGLGWGRGLHPVDPASGPAKKEGDGKSPAGIFGLSAAFGLAEPEKVKGIKLPYLQLLSGIECVDDPASRHYNSIVDRARIAQPDWSSSEKMREIGAEYRLGIVVEHNTELREAGQGSCIFLHIWKGPERGTSGCTAMAGDKIELLLAWLDPDARPVLVQLPDTEYRRLKKDWSLPMLEPTNTPVSGKGKF